MNITYIHQDGNVTGSAISLMNMLAGFKDHPINVHIICLDDGDMIENFRTAGYSTIVCKHFRFWTAPGPRLFSKGGIANILSLFPFNGLKKAILQSKPDLVHVNDKAALGAIIAAKQLQLPVIVHARSPYFGARSSFMKKLSKYLITKYADQIIAVSENEYEEFDTDKKSLIYNTLNFGEIKLSEANKLALKKELGLNQADIVVGFVGQLSYRKGAWSFLEMASILTTAMPFTRFKFVLVAKYDSKANLQAEDKEQLPPDFHTFGEAISYYKDSAGLKDSLVLTGFRKDVLALVDTFDILTVFSCFGSIGRQAFEGLAVGTPLVVGRGRQKDTYQLHNKEFAVVVDSNDPTLMAEGVKVMQHRIQGEQAKIISNKAKEYAREKFDSRSNAENILEQYRNILVHV